MFFLVMVSEWQRQELHEHDLSAGLVEMLLNLRQLGVGLFQEAKS
jgi:hypothetical protein